MTSVPRARSTWPLALVSLLFVALPSLAQYKVIGPDGKVTYTDRDPGISGGKVTALGARPAPVAEATLPAELRQAASRFPVTLYVTTGSCDPCDAARSLLRQRGVPFAERQVISAEDGEALLRLSGGRDAPTLSIGGQILRGLAGEVWNQYLDSAGYPRESRLPSNYAYPAPTPLTERREAAPAAQRPAPVEAPVAAEPAPPPPGPITF